MDREGADVIVEEASSDGLAAGVVPRAEARAPPPEAVEAVQRHVAVGLPRDEEGAHRVVGEAPRGRVRGVVGAVMEFGGCASEVVLGEKGNVAPDRLLMLEDVRARVFARVRAAVVRNWRRPQLRLLALVAMVAMALALLPGSPTVGKRLAQREAAGAWHGGKGN